MRAALLLCAILSACGTVTAPRDEVLDAAAATDAAIAAGGPDAVVPGPDAGEPARGLELGDGSYAFGDMTVGQSGLPFSSRLVNAGEHPVGPLAVRLDGDHARDFVVDAAACRDHTLGSGAGCGFTLRFAPTAPGRRTARLVVDAPSSSAGTGASAVMTLAGQGLAPGALSLAPSSHPFADTAVGQASAEAELTITNTGDRILEAPRLAASDDYVVAPAVCPAALGARETCKVRVRFRPRLGGSRSSSLTATSGDQAAVAALGGTGTGAVAVVVEGDGASGSAVAGGPIACGATCEGVVAAARLALVATAAPGSALVSWSQAECGASLRCEVAIDAARKELRARFTRRVTLTVRVTADSTAVRTANGTVEVPGMDPCETAGAERVCTYTYATPTTIVLTQTPDDCSRFDGWTGCTVGTGGCSVDLQGDRTVTAAFRVRPRCDVDPR